MCLLRSRPQHASLLRRLLRCVLCGDGLLRCRILLGGLLWSRTLRAVRRGALRCRVLRAAILTNGVLSRRTGGGPTAAGLAAPVEPVPDSEGSRPMPLSKAAAAQRVVECVATMADEGRPLMLRILPGDDLHWWTHYPQGDAKDALTGCRWYYHIHAPGDRDPAEHGHFHLFLDRSFFDEERPLAGPTGKRKGRPDVVHVAGLAIDFRGIPVRWFATNRWVTDEWLYPAEAIIARLDAFDVDATPEDLVVNQFLTAMTQLYADDLADLLVERDRRLRELGLTRGDTRICEAENDVLAMTDIDLDDKVDRAC